MIWMAAALMSGLTVTGAVGHPAATVTKHDTKGYDVGWPQCAGHSAHNMPSGHPSYVILGLTHGTGHTTNPCLASQVQWARSRGVRTGAYVVASYPARWRLRRAGHGLYGACGHSTRCRLRNEGATQAADAVATMRASGLRAPRIWIDVEYGGTAWGGHHQANAAVIEGIVGGLRAKGVSTGVYTTPYMWHAIAGGYHLDVPNWLPIGHRPRHKARQLCNTTATGGATWLAQYTRALDQNLTCPVLNPVPGEHGKYWPYRNSTLKLLSTGKAVRAVQRLVGEPVTGEYGPTTALSVAGWQGANGLRRTGEVHPSDWRVMGAFRTYGGHGFWLSKIARRP
jgi:hypothetical protein